MHAHRERVDEQSDHRVRARNRGTATRSCRAENNILFSSVATQQQCPTSLQYRVQRYFRGVTKPCDRRCEGLRKICFSSRMLSSLFLRFTEIYQRRCGKAAEFLSPKSFGSV